MSPSTATSLPASRRSRQPAFVEAPDPSVDPAESRKPALVAAAGKNLHADANAEKRPAAADHRFLQRLWRNLVDEDTGEPVVHSVGRASELYPPGKNHHCIPDLTVRWMETPAHRHRALVSPRYGRIPWPTPGKNPDGRSGHHRSTGWLIATAPGVGAGGNLADASILDLAPTALALLEEPVPDGMRGKPIGAVDR